MPKEELDEEQLVREVRPLIEDGGKLLSEANGIIRGLDPDGRIQRNAKQKSATHEATPEEFFLADVLKELTVTVAQTIESAKRKLEGMPHAKDELNPLWGLLNEPLVQILAGVGLLLGGVLGIVGRLVSRRKPLPQHDVPWLTNAAQRFGARWSRQRTAGQSWNWNRSRQVGSRVCHRQGQGQEEPGASRWSRLVDNTERPLGVGFHLPPGTEVITAVNVRKPDAFPRSTYLSTRRRDGVGLCTKRISASPSEQDSSSSGPRLLCQAPQRVLVPGLDESDDCAGSVVTQRRPQFPFIILYFALKTMHRKEGVVINVRFHNNNNVEPEWAQRRRRATRPDVKTWLLLPLEQDQTWSWLPLVRWPSVRSTHRPPL